MRMSVEENMQTIVDLKPRMKSVDVRFKVINKEYPREIFSRRDQSVHYISNTKVGDSTGIVSMPLWDDAIERIEEGKTYILKNGHTGLHRGRLLLKIGRHSKIVEAKKEIEDVNRYNDKSAETHGYRQHQRHYFQGY